MNNFSNYILTKNINDSLERAKYVAEDSGVNLNELSSLTITLGVNTLRSGAEIGNILKNILTRIHSKKTLLLLEDLNIQTQNSNKETRSAIEILQELSLKFDSLSDSDKKEVEESISGIYQVKFLSVLLSDLRSDTSLYKQTLDSINQLDQKEC